MHGCVYYRMQNSEYFVIVHAIESVCVCARHKQHDVSYNNAQSLFILFIKLRRSRDLLFTS